MAEEKIDETIRIGSIVANMNHETIGIVLDVFYKDGDVRTDADGCVPISDLAIFNILDHKDFSIAPSTRKRILIEMDE